MKRTLTILTGALAAQGALAAALLLSENDNGAFEATEPLIVLEQSDVNRLVIADEMQEIVIEKSADRWVLPSLDGFAANASKVEDLLNDIADLKRGWPVASNRSSAARFKVDDNAFERRLDFSASNGKTSTLYLGDTPTFKRLYVRNADDDNVYNVEFSTVDAPANMEDWTGPEALHIAAEDVAEIRIDGLSLISGNDGAFSLIDLSDDEQMRDSDVRRFVSTLLQMPFDEVLSGDNDVPDFTVPTLKAQLVKNDGAIRTYQLLADSQDADTATDYFLKSSDHPQILKVAKYRIDEILNIDRAQFVEGKPEDPETTGNTSSGDTVADGLSASVSEDEEGASPN